jgi:hypothetical protein
MEIVNGNSRPDKHLERYTEEEKRIIRTFAKLIFKSINNENSISVRQDIGRRSK